MSVGSRRLKLSNLDKVLYPEAGFTKAQVIDYYTRIWPAISTHLKNRPLTLKRYPNGVESDFFYEKNCPKHRPPWVRTTPVWSEGNRRVMDYCLVQDLPSMVWLANLATLELHTSLSLARDVAVPTVLVFDLDPGPPATIVECCEVGLHLRKLFARAGLEAFAKTSGSKGLQLYLPLNTPGGYESTKAVSRGIAERLQRELPGRVVSRQLKTLREGKVLIDWSQNDPHKTTVSVYSLRARARPTVSTPVTWAEVEDAVSRRDPQLLVFDSEAVLERAERLGDLFEPVAKLKQRLPDSLP
ncbi:MAG: non-homologous end-joining DNA ligase [Candidatus Dormibacterales bacterium]